MSALSLPPGYGLGVSMTEGAAAGSAAGFVFGGPVGATAGGAGGMLFSRWYDKKKRKRQKKRAKRKAAAAAAELNRQQQVARLGQMLQRVDRLRSVVAREVNRAQMESEALAKYAAQLGDVAEAEQFVQEVGSIQQVAADIAAALVEYEVILPAGHEPVEFVQEVYPQAEAGYRRLHDISRQARILWKRAQMLTVHAQDLLRDKQAAQQAQEAARQAKLAAERDALARSDYEARRRLEHQRDLEWEARLRERREWMRNRRRAVRRGEPDPGPWIPPEDRAVKPASPAAIAVVSGQPIVEREDDVDDGVGLGGWFSDLFGSSKRKEKKRAKRARRAAQAAAEKAKKDREQRALERRKQSLRLAMRDLNTEAGAAAGWISRIRASVNQTPDLPAALVDESMASLSEWEAALQEIRAGVGELDLATEEANKQSAYMGEVQAALAAVRTIRIKAQGLRETVDAQVKLNKAHELKLDRLMVRQRELGAREKALTTRQAEQQRALATERAATVRVQQRRAQAADRRQLSIERQRLAEDLRFLRQLERRYTLLQRFRSTA